MKKGFVAGNFDVIHPGYIKMFKECTQCSDVKVVTVHAESIWRALHTSAPENLAMACCKFDIHLQKYVDT